MLNLGILRSFVVGLISVTAKARSNPAQMCMRGRCWEVEIQKVINLGAVQQFDPAFCNVNEAALQVELPVAKLACCGKP